MISRITIRNFKSLRDVTVDLGPMTVLIGRSGSGKSNFVNALRFLRDYLSLRNDQFVRDGIGWRKVLSATADDGVLSFAVRLAIDGLSGPLDYELSLRVDKDFHASALQEEALHVGGVPVFMQRQGQWIVTPALVAPPSPGQLMLGILYGIPEVKIAHIALTRGIGCYDFPGDVLTSPERREITRDGLADDAANFLHAFDGIAGNLFELSSLREIVAAIREVNPSVKTIESETVQQNRIVVGHQVAGAKSLAFDLSEESEGLRRFLAHLIALYQIPPRQTLLFEEPEKGIFPAALSLLGESFRASAERGRSQVLLTTHSPQLLDGFAPEQIREVRMVGYETRISPVPTDQVGAIRDHLMTTGELLTVDAAHLQPAPADD